MSDNKASSTPVIVGVVIALLGILVELYFADNAREQLASANVTNNAATSTTSTASANAAVSSNRSETVADLEELPPLDPIVITQPQPEETGDTSADNSSPAAVDEREAIISADTQAISYEPAVGNTNEHEATPVDNTPVENETDSAATTD